MQVHQYKNNGYNMILDVPSGSVHVADDVLYDAVAVMRGGGDSEKIREALAGTYPAEEIEEAIEEIGALKSEGSLFSEEPYSPAIDRFSKAPTVVKALCLHIAHDCNLACRYCFAEEGEYHGRRALMSLEVGKKALDFLVKNSGYRQNLEVDFFGGWRRRRRTRSRPRSSVSRSQPTGFS